MEEPALKKRKMLERGREEEGVGLAAVFPNNRLRNWKSAKISEHVGTHPITGKPGHTFYVMRSEISKNVLHVGEPFGKNKGVDHCVVIRNKRTGEMHVEPVKMVKFAPQWHNDPEVFLGHKAAPKVDFRKNRGSTEGALEQKRKLIMEFGSAKKQKFLAQQMESEGKNESMSSLMTSVARVSAAIDAQQAVQSSLTEPVALLRPTQSSVLPKANNQAKEPSQVYSLGDIIAPEEVACFKTEATEFADMKYEEKIKNGYEMFVADLGKMLPRDEAGKIYRSGAVLYLSALAKLTKIIFSVKSSKKTVNEMEFNTTTSIDGIRNLVERNFFAGAVSRYQKRNVKVYGPLSAAEKDKILAHQIVLVLTLGGLKFDLKPMAAFTGNSELKIETVAKAMGCQVERTKKTKEGAEWATVVLVGPPKTKGRYAARSRFGRR